MAEPTTTDEYERLLRARPPDLRRAACPSRASLELVADKWTPLVVAALAQGVSRNGQLKRHIEGISQKMLTQTLRRLETHGLVDRVVHEQVPPNVEYRLTALAASLVPVLEALCHWAETTMVDVELARYRHTGSPAGGG